MWKVVAEEDQTCTECRHRIRAGENCLSQMPEEMPAKFRRRKYETFHINCAECAQQKKLPYCYVRHLNHWYTSTEITKEPVQCGYCEDSIPKGKSVIYQKLFAWPESPLDSEYENISSDGSGVITTATATESGIAGAAKGAHAGSWHNLSSETQRQFQTRGLGRGLGSRTPAQARQLYETKVPLSVRNQGEQAVLKFIDGKHRHFSHGNSVFNSPDKAKEPSNVFIENAKKNLSRGNRNMTSKEIAAAHSANRRLAFGAAAQGVARGGAISAAVEAPIAGIENFYHWKRGRKSAGQAVKDSAKSTAGAGAVGAGVTATALGVSKGAAMVGISPTLGPAGPPLAVAGVALMVGATAYRIIKASKRDLPLDEYRLFLCKDTDCKNRFAWAAISRPNTRRLFHDPRTS